MASKGSSGIEVVINYTMSCVLTSGHEVVLM